MSGYLADIWSCRYFWLSLVRKDLRTRYRRSMLGMGWSLLHPIAMTTILCLVFMRILGATIEDYAPFLICGLSLWQYIVNCSLIGCETFLQGEAYIRQFPAPLAIYPLRTVLCETLHFLIALSLAITVSAVLAWPLKGVPSPLVLLTLVPSFFVLVTFAWSLAVLTGSANVLFPDTRHLLQILFQLLFYLSPVMLKPELLIDRGLGWIIYWNPLVPFFSLIRMPITQGLAPPIEVYAMACLTTGVCLTAAGFTLARQQKRLIFSL